MAVDATVTIKNPKKRPQPTGKAILTVAKLQPSLPDPIIAVSDPALELDNKSLYRLWLFFERTVVSIADPARARAFHNAATELSFSVCVLAGVFRGATGY